MVMKNLMKNIRVDLFPPSDMQKHKTIVSKAIIRTFHHHVTKNRVVISTRVKHLSAEGVIILVGLITLCY